MKSLKNSLILLTLLCLFFSNHAHGYVLFDQKFPDGILIMQEQMGSPSGTLLDGNTSWNAVVEGAMATWNTYLGGLQFAVVRNSTASISSGDKRNSLFWNSTVFGSAFGSSTLAVTYRKYTGSTVTEADIVFNNAKPWNSYRGALRNAASGGHLNDLRRVSLHELGHVIGLDHPDESGQSVVAQMNSAEGDLGELAADDIAGAQALYGGRSPTPSSLQTPTNGSKLSSTSVTFTWNAATINGQYVIWVGSSLGSGDLLVKDEGQNLSDTLALPADGRKVYVRLYTWINGNWYSNDYSYTTPDLRAVMSSPSSGSTLSSSSVKFSWSASSSATQYVIWVGNSPGVYDLIAKDERLNLSDTLTLPADGRTVYVRLFSLINGAWYSNDYSYTTPDTRAVMSSPTSGSTLSGSSVKFSWNASSNATQYALWVGSSPGTYDLVAKNEGQSLSDTLTLPTAGRVMYVRLFSLINGSWYYRDYSYTAANTSAAMSSPASGSTLATSSVKFSWNAGANATQYAIWVGNNPGTYDLYAKSEGQSLSDTIALPTDGRTVYVRLYSMINGTWGFNNYSYTTANTKAVMSSPTSGSTLSGSAVKFSWSASSNATQYALWVGSTPDSYDLYAGNEGTNLSRNVTLPTDGRPVYVRLWSMIAGTWQYNSYIYTTYLQTSGLRKAQLTTPVNGSACSAASVTFNWSAGSGATQYALWVGSTPDSYDLYAGNESTNLSRSVTLPTDGRPVYVRLWSMISGAWQYNSYIYTTMDGRAQMLTPTNGSTFASASASFTWSTGTGVSQYALWLGSTPGAYDICAENEGTSRSKTFTVPADGRTIYVRLWSMINGTWSYNNYVYGAH